MNKTKFSCMSKWGKKILCILSIAGEKWEHSFPFQKNISSNSFWPTFQNIQSATNNTSPQSLGHLLEPTKFF